jgi:hypothetical protein
VAIARGKLERQADDAAAGQTDDAVAGQTDDGQGAAWLE